MAAIKIKTGVLFITATKKSYQRKYFQNITFIQTADISLGALYPILLYWVASEIIYALWILLRQNIFEGIDIVKNVTVVKFLILRRPF